MVDPRSNRSPAEDIAKLLKQVSIAPRQGGGGTLLTEPVLVLRGKYHQSEFSVFDQAGNRLGSALPSGSRKGPARRPSPSPEVYDFLDIEGQRLLRLQDVSRAWVKPGPWSYELRAPHAVDVITLRHPNRWGKFKGSVIRGSEEIATLRHPNTNRFVIEDRSGAYLGRVLAIPRRGLQVLVRSAYSSPNIVVEVDDAASVEVRHAALAMAIVLDREELDQAGGG